MQGTPRHPLSFCALPEDEKYLGSEFYFNNITSYWASTDPCIAYATWCVARFVINKHSSTLAKGARVIHHNDATYLPGVAVGTVAGADTVFAGFVCPFIETATVAAGHCFWLIRRGFTKVGYDGSANFAVGDNLSGAASGWVNEATENYTDPWIVGKSLVAKTSGSAGDLITAFVDVPFP